MGGYKYLPLGARPRLGAQVCGHAAMRLLRCASANARAAVA